MTTEESPFHYKDLTDTKGKGLWKKVITKIKLISYSSIWQMEVLKFGGKYYLQSTWHIYLTESFQQQSEGDLIISSIF